MKVAIPTRHLRATEPEATLNTETDPSNPTVSQTTGASPYVLRRPGGTETFVLIDTPGLSDTNGIEQDNQNIGTILDAANRCPSISAIILVANGTVCKFGANVRNTLSMLQGNIPDAALENIVYIMTNADVEAASNFVVSKAPFAPKCVCYMNNSAFSSDPNTWQGRARASLVDSWRASMYVIKELFDTISSMGKVATDQFATMKEQRDIVQSALHEGRLKVPNKRASTLPCLCNID